MLVIAIHPVSTFHPRLLPINDQPSTINRPQTCEPGTNGIRPSTINHQPSTVHEPANL